MTSLDYEVLHAYLLQHISTFCRFPLLELVSSLLRNGMEQSMVDLKVSFEVRFKERRFLYFVEDLLSLLFLFNIGTSGNRPFFVIDFGKIPVLLSEFPGLNIVTTIFGDAGLLVRYLPR